MEVLLSRGNCNPWPGRGDKSGKKRFDRHACQVASRMTVIPREYREPQSHVFPLVFDDPPPRVSLFN